LGAIVTGPDLDSLDQQELSAIRECLLEHEVIFFRDQAHMTPASHLKLAQEFGKVQHHEAYPHVTGFSAITVLENDRDNPSLIEQWVRAF
jgi:alpha-ketoglutarate-dependent taurine dioxygenase